MFNSPGVNASAQASKKIWAPSFEPLGAITTSGDTEALAAAQLEDMKLFDFGGAHVYATLTRDPGGVFGIWLYKCLRANLPLGPWELVSETPMSIAGSEPAFNSGWTAAGNLIQMPDTSWRLYHYGLGSGTSTCDMLLKTAAAGVDIEDLPAQLGSTSRLLSRHTYLNDAQIYTPTMTGLDHWVALVCDGLADGETYTGTKFTGSDGLAWTLDTENILSPGAAGEWDSKSVIPIGQPVFRNGRWEAPYQAASSNRWQVGWFSLNANLSRITKDANNPVLVLGGGGPATNGSRENPGVLMINGKLHLFSVDASKFGSTLLAGGQGDYTVNVSREL